LKIILASRALLAALCFLGLCLPLRPARADIYQWAGGDTGDFDSANWYDNSDAMTTNMEGPPGGGDTAIIPDNVILSGSGSVGMLESSSSQGGGLNGTFSCNTVGSILLTGGTLSAGIIGPVSGSNSGLIDVVSGQFTAGSISGFYPDFNVSGGGSVMISSTVPMGEGSVSGQGSTFTVNGALMNFNGGPSAGGTVTASTIQSNNGLSGITFDDGAGSLVTTTGNAEYDGQGIMVTNGAAAAIGGDLLLYPTQSPFVGGGGSGYFDGAGSAATVGGAIRVGPGPSGGASSYCGSVTISDGALVRASGLYADSGVDGGFVTMSNGGLLQLGSTGTIIGGLYKNAYLSLDTNSGVTLTGAAMAIGYATGSSGMVSLADSSYLNATSVEIALGNAAGSSGTLQLGTSSTMQVGGATGAFLHVGDAGTGSVEINGASTLQVAAGVPFEVGSQAGSNGSVGVGSASGLTLSGSAVIGNQGTGVLTVGGTGASISASGDFFVGGNSSLSASTGNGVVSVAQGAQITLSGGPLQQVGVGNGKGGVGEIYADGTGSVLKFTGDAIVGAYGSGELAADAGAAVQSASLQFGTTPDSSGTLLVYNSGTVWTSTNTVSLGGDGTTGGGGLAVVLDSGLLRIYRKLYIPNTGVADLTKTPGISSNFPKPAPPAASVAPGRIFVGSDNFGPDGAIRVGNGGVLTGKGKQAGTKVIHTNVIGNVVIGIGGTFQPGGDPDVFSIEGNCDLSDGGAAKGGGETDIEVAGTATAGTDYDQIITTGKVTAGGTLRLVLMAGYKPEVGDTIDPIKAKTMTGAFKEVVSPGLTLSPATTSGKLTVKVMSVADVPAPDITSAKTATAHVGKPFTYQIDATGLPAGYAATGLPDGLDIDPSTGLISGTPTAAGVSSVKLSSTSVGGTGAATLELTVDAAVIAGAPVITSATSETAQPEAAFTYKIVASNKPTSFAATDLPAGLRLDAATGVISGKPGKAGTFAVTLSATNAIGTGTATLELVVSLPVVKVAATVPVIAVGGDKAGEFTVSIPEALKTPLTIHYKVSGSAKPGTDYVKLTGEAIIKAGTTRTIIKVTPKGDLDGALSKVVKVTLENGAGYAIGTTKPVTVKIIAGQ
jgi:T5SS/PEP-CTERM-associated repeat protein